VKQTGFLLLPIFFLYEWNEKRDFKRAVKHASILAVAGMVFFSAYFLLSFIAGEQAFQLGTQHTFLRLTQPLIDIKLSLIQHLLVFIWLGPLFLAFLYVAVRDWKRHALASIWAVLAFFLFTFVYLDATKPIDRYFGILVPPLCMIGGAWISRQETAEWKKIILGSFAAAAVILFAANNLPGEYLPFYPKEAYVDKVLGLDFSFMIPITGGSGPIGFYLHAGFVIAGFLLAGILFALSLIKPVDKRFLMAFLGCAFAFNVVLMSEHLWSVSNPDIDKINKESISYARGNDLKHPLFVFRNPAFKYYLEDTYGGKYRDLTILDYYVFDRADIAQMISEKKPTVIIIDFPRINRDSDFWKAVADCRLLRSFEDKGLTAAYVFDCK
jgi:hypothetical protein